MALVGARTRTGQRVSVVADVEATPSEDIPGVVGVVDVPRRSNVGGLEWHLVRPRIASRLPFLLVALWNHLGAGREQAKWVDFETLEEGHGYIQMVLRLPPH